MNSEGKKVILLVKNRAMGDGIMGLSAVEYLRELWPDAYIIYGVPAWVSTLFSMTKNDADEILPLNLKTLSDFLQIWKILKEKRVDLIHEMHQSGRSGKIFHLYKILNFGKVKYSFHNHHLKSGTLIHDQGVIKSVIQRDLDGIYSCLSNKESSIPDFLDYRPKISLIDKVSATNKNKIVIGVIATRKTKMWRVENYIQLMNLINEFYIKELGKDVEFVIPLSKSIDDEKLKNQILDQSEVQNYLIKQVTLDLLPRLIAGSKLYIGNDTGLKHLAVSLGVKTYTFFGPEPPNEWHPYKESEHPYFYKTPLECRTTKLHYCGLHTCSSMICLNEFTPQLAFDETKKDLG